MIEVLDTSGGTTVVDGLKFFGLLLISVALVVAPLFFYVGWGGERDSDGDSKSLYGHMLLLPCWGLAALAIFHPSFGVIVLHEEAAAANAEAVTQDESREHAVEQFHERYGDVTLLEAGSSTASVLSLERTLVPEPLAKETGWTTYDVQILDDDGQMHRDAYLLRESSDDPDVSHAITLMVEPEGSGAIEFEPVGEGKK